MRVFILGTGRCGTMTCAKACSYMSGFTVGHETRRGLLDRVFDWPDNHIEVDPHLFWVLPQLIEQYPTALYIHLAREREACITSLAKRGSLMDYAHFTAQIPIKGLHLLNMYDVATLYYDFTVKAIDICLRLPGVSSMKLWCAPSKYEWQQFLQKFPCYVNEEASFNEWSKRYNAS